MLEEGLFDRKKALLIRRGDLPHWRQEGGLYFVTFRLSDSLPHSLLRQWIREQGEWRQKHADADRKTLLLRSFEEQRRIERWLDRGYGSCILTDPIAKQIVTDALSHFDGVRYEFGEATVAANHVHALLRVSLGVDVSDVLYSWKRFTASTLLEMASVRAAFAAYKHLWQTESFDHIVRSKASLEKIQEYIRGHDQPQRRE